jgi:hypothetical protein
MVSEDFVKKGQKERFLARRVELTCGGCGGKFTVQRADYKARLVRNKGVFVSCSTKCSAAVKKRREVGA